MRSFVIESNFPFLVIKHAAVVGYLQGALKVTHLTQQASYHNFQDVMRKGKDILIL